MWSRKRINKSYRWESNTVEEVLFLLFMAITLTLSFFYLTFIFNLSFFFLWSSDIACINVNTVIVQKPGVEFPERFGSQLLRCPGFIRFLLPAIICKKLSNLVQFKAFLLLLVFVHLGYDLSIKPVRPLILPYLGLNSRLIEKILTSTCSTIWAIPFLFVDLSIVNSTFLMSQHRNSKGLTVFNKRNFLPNPGTQCWPKYAFYKAWYWTLHCNISITSTNFYTEIHH